LVIITLIPTLTADALAEIRKFTVLWAFSAVSNTTSVMTGSHLNSAPSRSVLEKIQALRAGIFALLILVYPISVGLVAYFVLFWVSAHAKLEIAVWIGYGSLSLLPCYMLGTAFSGKPTGLPNKPVSQTGVDKTQLIEIWKTCQDQLMHFDNTSLQIQNYAVTLLVAVTGAAAFALKEHLDWMAVAILSAGVLGWLAFYFMDKHFYHRLLIGAVKHTLTVELAFGPALGLSGSIASESPSSWGKRNISAEQKFEIFYAVGLTFLIIFIGTQLPGAMAPSTNRGVADFARRLATESASKPDLYARKDTLKINGGWITGDFISNGAIAACTSQNNMAFPLASIDRFDEIGPCPDGSTLVRAVLKP
jgi:hypothetical protein